MEGEMPLSVYDVTVPVMVHGLNVMDDYLDHAQALERSRGMEPGNVLAQRLAPDMLSFGEQFAVGCSKVESHMAQLAGRDRPPPHITAIMYPALKGRLVDTRGFLQALQANELAGAQTHIYELSPPSARGWFSGDDYIRHLVLPDFFFHIAMAHAILRHLGALVGKRDYLGSVRQRTGGDYS
jgi:hypothetical protein